MSDVVKHEQLVERAGRWLCNSRRCKLVIVNAKPWACQEHPDAIGWLPGGESIVVECKVSQADAAVDLRKPWRRSSKGMGYQKYYLATDVVKWPDYMERGAGLLRLKGNRVVVEREAEKRQDRAWSEELCLLLAQLSSGHAMIGMPEHQGDVTRAAGEGVERDR